MVYHFGCGADVVQRAVSGVVDTARLQAAFFSAVTFFLINKNLKDSYPADRLPGAATYIYDSTPAVVLSGGFA